MKSKLLIVLSCLLAAGLCPSYGQENVAVPRTPRPMVVPPPPPPGGQPQMRAPQSDNPQGLDENCRIVLQGDLGETRKVDLALTGTGPQYRVNTILGESGEPLSVEFAVTPVAGGGLKVSYSIGLRVKIKSGDNNFSYQDCQISGSVACKTGKPVEIFRGNGASLTLTVEDPAAEKGK